METINEIRHQVHNLIILDESGSMDSIKGSIIAGFNELVQTIKGIEKQYPEQEHLISLITFNGYGNKLIHFIDPASKLAQIDGSRYKPDASTPLFDAMGFGILKLKQALEGNLNCNVLVTIHTDGEENASGEFSGKDIKALVEELKMNNWTFTYIGTEHDVEKMAMSISITNTLSFDKDEEGIHQMFLKESRSRMIYSDKIKMKKSTMDGFYDEEEKKQED